MPKTVSSAELKRRWRKRQQEILKTLTPKLFAEYCKLDRLIKAVRDEEQKGRKQEPPVPEYEGFFPPPIRVPLSVHRKKLIKFLNERGPTTRHDIIGMTGIPPG